MPHLYIVLNTVGNLLRRVLLPVLKDRVFFFEGSHYRVSTHLLWKDWWVLIALSHDYLVREVVPNHRILLLGRGDDVHLATWFMKHRYDIYIINFLLELQQTLAVHQLRFTEC
jgi:hypothetical protein